MRLSGAILAAAVSGTVLAQSLSNPPTLESLAAMGTEALAAAANGLDLLDPAVRDIAAPAIAAWVMDSRDAAVARGVEKIPTEVRDALNGFVPHEILERVRWRSDDEAFSISQSLFVAGYASALTLEDVVLFASTENANDPKLWAHEIYHVMQYEEWGVDGFVTRYLTDRASVERDAWEFRWQWMKATDRIPQL